MSDFSQYILVYTYLVFVCISKCEQFFVSCILIQVLDEYFTQLPHLYDLLRKLLPGEYHLEF